ncbi:MAG: CocE/NonD family hydrolase, partial [Ferruginibacter sp.]
MKIIGILFFLLITESITKAQNADSTWFADNYSKMEQYITMRDGIRLFTSIYLPKVHSEKHPILLSRSPFACDPYGENKFQDFPNNHYREYFKEHYIMVLQDVRGKFMSEGTFIEIRPFNQNKKSNTDTDESTDAFDTVDWLVKNLPANNGKVGVIGHSYIGFYAIQAALSNHPAIVAVSPQAPVADWFMGDDFHHNGALLLMNAFHGFEAGYLNTRKHLTTEWFTPSFVAPTKDKYGFYLRTGAIPNFTKLTGDSIVFWNEMLKHPDYDDWWKARNTRAALKNIKPAMLLVGGLFDAEDCFGAWNTYKAIEKQSPATNNKIVMGPWFHGQWTRTDGTRLGNIRFGSNTVEWFANNMELPFFNYYLKGKGSIDNIKEANIFFTGENNWKQFSKWPPAGVTNKKLFFQQDGILSWEKSTSPKQYTEYISDPAKPVPYSEGIHDHRTNEFMTDDQRFASFRPDVLVFKTAVLTGDITLAGPLTAHLKVSISSTDADFVVKLIDVFPDDFSYGNEDSYIMNGYEMMVCADVFRGRYRKSFEKPSAFIPNAITAINYSMNDVAHTFKKGHRIMVHVQSSWFPLVDRNPQKFIDIYHAKDDQFQKATIRS